MYESDDKMVSVQINGMYAMLRVNILISVLTHWLY